MRPLLAVAFATIALTLSIAAPSVAGGWAASRLDALPERFVAGETYALGYTILQHGTHPVAVDRTAVVFTPLGGGPALSFPGRAEGAAGHYVAAISVPSAGEWAWAIDQGLFGPYALGTRTVHALGAAPEVRAA
ncbi:MAG: hypothetical protein ACRDF0_08855, partial [Candidatus Limnocylindria bacterium]